MKKLYFSLSILLLTFSASAQAYRPLLDSINEWYYTTNVLGVRLADQTASMPCYYPLFLTQGLAEYTDIDTTIGAYTYKRLISYSGGCTEGYLREDTAARKVYFMDNVFSPEVLLYDFSMQPGDSITVNFVMASYYPSGIYLLDSISTVNTLHGPRRYFYLRCHSCVSSPTMVWAEGVGNLDAIAYPYSMDEVGSGLFACAGDYHNSAQILTCFYHGTRVYEDTCMLYEATHNQACIGFNDSCDYGSICGSVRDLSQLASMDIFPNPSNGKTTISIDVLKNGKFELLVWDISGKQLITSKKIGMMAEGKHAVDLDLSALSEGIYFVELRTQEGSVFRKLIIQ